MSRTPLSIAEVEAACDALDALPDAELATNAAARAVELLAMGEDVVAAWIAARGAEPTNAEVEGFRLLALHRQGAKGVPSFNACRETCRELVYHHNLVAGDPVAPESAQRLRMATMITRHLALFIGGKLVVEGLGDFCCSSRPIRQADVAAPEAMEN
ncbi:hypothetical protein VK792_15985 [Mesobacterium sp. TK19101]|uniref:Uncharacterized protein n=1 Tax=Mesobacterium hydrothermale TaxID=3111907 RepID=A0ABU6HMZ2_9RHOB|nr:hypothetical protein [Mesobacterium sp. TK19101]MEC3862793.1 hypothetical protein [Mesobacterium sp. TK19101]